MRNAEHGYFIVAVPFGSMKADDLAALAGLSRRYADGTIRVTPWKSLVLPGVSPSDAAAVGEAVSDFGLIASPDDPRSRIVACAGRPSCTGAHAETRADAAFFAAAGLPATGLVHVSGCSKGCALPGPAAATLVATTDGYDLVNNGRAGDPPDLTGLPRAAAARILASAKALPVPDPTEPASGCGTIR